MVISTSDFDVCITCLYENQHPVNADLSHSGVWIFLSHQGPKPSSGTLQYVVPDGTYDSVYGIGYKHVVPDGTWKIGYFDSVSPFGLSIRTATFEPFSGNSDNPIQGTI
jgi:hypothetical protein